MPRQPLYSVQASALGNIQTRHNLSREEVVDFIKEFAFNIIEVSIQVVESKTVYMGSASEFKPDYLKMMN